MCGNQNNGLATPAVTAIVIAMTDNDAPYVRFAVESVNKQSVACACIVVVESSNDWIEEALVGLDANVVRSPMSYLGKARNFGSLHSNTEFIAHLDADDIWCPTKISEQLTVARATSADLVGTDHYLVDERGKIYARSRSKYLPMPSSWLMKRSLWERCPFDDDIPRSEDGDWWRRYSRDCHVRRLPRPLLKYRVRDKSLSSYSGSKARKLFVRRVSKGPIRPVILAMTRLSAYLSRTDKYAWHPSW